jgi:hypothetical protein
VPPSINIGSGCRAQQSTSTSRRVKASDVRRQKHKSVIWFLNFRQIIRGLFDVSSKRHGTMVPTFFNGGKMTSLFLVLATLLAATSVSFLLRYVSAIRD